MKRLLEMTTHEFAAEVPRLCFWPVGTVEAHDLAPLGTDVLAPEKLAEDLAGSFGALLLPTLPFGLVSSLAGHPGGMWMSDATYSRLIFELLASIRRSGIESAIVFNGHGGNTGVLSEALSEVWKKTGLKVAFLDWWSIAGDISEAAFGSGGGHGGSDELAIVHAALPGFALPCWDGSRSFFLRDGMKAWPAPGSAIRYSSGPSIPLTEESATDFYTAVRERIRSLVAEILDGWGDRPAGGADAR
jgi:creatinine amidohydrolase